MLKINKKYYLNLNFYKKRGILLKCVINNSGVFMAARQKSTAMEIAYNLILEKIINERLTPGTPLREEHLAEEFGISSTPVREAFRSLEHEGWVQRIPYRGTCLRTFSEAEIVDLYLLREAIEGVAVKLAVERASEEDWNLLAEAIAEDAHYLAELKKGNQRCMPSYDSDRLFHQAIITAAHSPILLDRNMTLRAQLNLIALTSNIDTTLEDVEQVHEEHKMIFDAMKRNWADAAEKLLRQHIVRASRKFQNILLRPSAVK